MTQRLIARILAILVLFYGGAIGALYLAGRNTPDVTATAAVVYGNMVYPDGTLSERLKSRLDAAYRLYSEHRVLVVVVSGGLGAEGHNEAEKMAHYLATRSVGSEHILVDPDGDNTSLTARNAFLRLGDVPVVAVTQQFHLARAELALRNAGFSTVYGAHPDFVEWRDVYSAVREVPAYLKYWLGNL